MNREPIRDIWFSVRPKESLAFDLAEADTLSEAAAQRNLFFAINFNHRSVLRQVGTLCRPAMRLQSCRAWREHVAALGFNIVRYGRKQLHCTQPAYAIDSSILKLP